MKIPILLTVSKAVLVVLMSTLCAATVLAQPFPTKPVRLIVGFATGGGTDTIARALSRKLADTWPHALVVENRPGADGSIATEIVARSPADGHTKVMTSINLVHVPYKGTGAAVIDLMGGHVQVMFGSVSGTLPFVRSGKLRALGISSPQRWPTLPQIPTVAESGVAGFEAGTWYGMLAPAGTPAAAVSKLQTDVAAALHAPDVLKYVVDLGFNAVGNTPAEFGEVIRNDMARWGKLIRSLEQKK